MFTVYTYTIYICACVYVYACERQSDRTEVTDVNRVLLYVVPFVNVLSGILSLAANTSLSGLPIPNVRPVTAYTLPL